MRRCVVFVCTAMIGQAGCSARHNDAALPASTRPDAGQIASPDGGGAADSSDEGQPTALLEGAAPESGVLSTLTFPTRRLRRLSNREYDNVVSDLLGDGTRPARAFILDSYPNGYDNGSAGLAVQSDQVVSYEEAAEGLAARTVANDMARLIGQCDPSTQGSQACFQAFLTDFLPRAYRRPVTSTEQQRLGDVFAFASQQSGGFTTGIRTVLEAVLQSPQFLYREELGAADGTRTGAVSLTDDEVAAELSFMLTGSTPDAELRNAVSQGALRSVADYRREALRLLVTPGAKGALRAFLHEWMATDRLGSLSKLSTVYPNFNFAIAASMHQELDRFYDDVLWARAGSLRDLLTSNASFVDSALGAMYGVSVSDAGFTPVTLDAHRGGILGRLGYLAVHSDTDSSGPIARGVFLMQALLCSPPPPPPPNVPPVPAVGDPRVAGTTTRQRFALHAANATCAACHTLIDGFGFGFEEFDGLGVYRTTESGHPIDSSGIIVATGDIDGPFDGVADLAAKLVRSQRPLDCYARQAYRYAMGQVEPPVDDLSVLSAGFSVDARMSDVLMSIVANPVFVTRSFEAAGP